jgi:hypothetical protein
LRSTSACIDADEDAAGAAAQVLGYAMARPGQPKDMGYRAHFGRWLEDVLSELEARRDAGAPMSNWSMLCPELCSRLLRPASAPRRR